MRLRSCSYVDGRVKRRARRRCCQCGGTLSRRARRPLPLRGRGEKSGAYEEETMADIPRLNGAIKALESGKPTFVPFSPGEISSALTISAQPYDGVVFEMEHNPYDIK